MYIDIQEDMFVPGGVAEYSQKGHSRVIYCHDGLLYGQHNTQLHKDELPAGKAKGWQGVHQLESGFDGACAIRFECYEDNDPLENEYFYQMGVTSKKLWQGTCPIDDPCEIDVFALTIAPQSQCVIETKNDFQFILALESQGYYTDGTHKQNFTNGSVMTLTENTVTIDSQDKRFWGLCYIITPLHERLTSLPQADTYAYLPLHHMII